MATKDPYGVPRKARTYRRKCQNCETEFSTNVKVKLYCCPECKYEAFQKRRRKRAKLKKSS